MEVGVSMLNKNGSTLVESLFAFEIFISVLIMFVSLYMNLYRQEAKIQNLYKIISQQEVEISLKEDYIDIIQMVLH